MKFKHTKLENLVHTELCTQEYLLNAQFSNEQKRNLFLFRTRMANFSENFRNGSEAQYCRMCHLFPGFPVSFCKLRGNNEECLSEGEI